MALKNLTIVESIYFIMCEGHVWIQNHWISICLRARSYMTSHYTWRSVTTLHDFGSVLGGLLDTSFGLSQYHGHGYCWLVYEVALRFELSGFTNQKIPSSSVLLGPFWGNPKRRACLRLYPAHSILCKRQRTVSLCARLQAAWCVFGEMKGYW